MFKIWSEVYGGITGHRQGFMKKSDGSAREFDTVEEARKELPKSHRTERGVVFNYRVVDSRD